MACVKHYALNSMENMRFKIDVTCEEKTLNECHLPHYKQARAVYGWSATPLQWILQYWTPVEWTPVGVGVEWSEPSPTPVLQWTPRLNLG
jgi:hypothetical protein